MVHIEVTLPSYCHVEATDPQPLDRHYTSSSFRGLLSTSVYLGRHWHCVMSIPGPCFVLFFVHITSNQKLNDGGGLGRGLVRTRLSIAD